MKRPYINISNYITEIPYSNIPVSAEPEKKAKDLTEKAAIKAALVSASLAAPGGFAGVLTTLPDLAAIWKIQSQLVADIAAAYGKFGYLSKESLLWCLCKHSGAQITRDVAVRGLRVLASKNSARIFSRAIPVLGAVGCGAYAAYDTYAVAKTARKFFKDPEKLFLENK